VQTIVAVVGGTGAEGSGLALRFAHAGVRVRIGSRNLEKAQDTAKRIAASDETPRLRAIPTTMPSQEPASWFSPCRSRRKRKP
jgi:predicted dinucleotide-binding enzyme